MYTDLKNADFGEAAGMAVYSARAMLQDKGGDVWEMMVENIP
jgi:hypothetical protein